MGSLSKFIKSILLVAGIILVIFGISVAYGKANQYWKMLRDQIIQEQVIIQKGLEGEIKTLTTQKKNAEDQMARLKAERDQLKRKYATLQGEKNELEKKLAALVIPTDPDSIARKFRELGLQSAIVRSK